MAICCLMKLFDSGELLAYMLRLQLLSVGVFFGCILVLFAASYFLSGGKMKEGFKKRLGKTFAFSKKTANLFIASLVIIFLPPLVIAFLYSVDAQQVVIRTPWSAGEMLGYCGTMGAAFIALLGIVYGIVDAWDQQRTQSRMSAAPYFSMIMLTQKNKIGWAFMLPQYEGDPEESASSDAVSNSDSKGYYEVEERDTYVLIGNAIEYKDGLTNEQRKRVTHSYLSESIEGLSLATPNPTIYVPLRFKNVGPGYANNVKVGVNRKGAVWRAVRSLTLDHGESFYLGIFIDTQTDSAIGEYELGIAFYDCLGFRYMQSFELKVVKDEDGGHVAELECLGRKTIIDDQSYTN